MEWINLEVPNARALSDQSKNVARIPTDYHLTTGTGYYDSIHKSKQVFATTIAKFFASFLRLRSKIFDLLMLTSSLGDWVSMSMSVLRSGVSRLLILLT